MNVETKLKNIFLEPKANNVEIWNKYLDIIFVDYYVHWKRNYFPSGKIVIGCDSSNNYDWLDNLDYEFNTTLNQLKAHHSFYSPRYMVHMLPDKHSPQF